MPQRYCGVATASDIVHSWEDPDLSRNRLIESTFDSRLFPLAEMTGCEIVEYLPCFVRVSCKDQNGRATSGDARESKKRMTGFTNDDWIGV